MHLAGKWVESGLSKLLGPSLSCPTSLRKMVGALVQRIFLHVEGLTKSLSTYPIFVIFLSFQQFLDLITYVVPFAWMWDTISFSAASQSKGNILVSVFLVAISLVILLGSYCIYCDEKLAGGSKEELLAFDIMQTKGNDWFLILNLIASLRYSDLVQLFYCKSRDEASLTNTDWNNGRPIKTLNCIINSL